MKRFTTKLLEWHADNPRHLPWKGTTNPYIIWLSEIMLQQTRVEQGTSYFLRFTRRWPTIQELAAATLDEVLKEWQGLGYYARARNMHATAQYITKELGGEFPGTYEGLLNLKGVGAYTAAAIASFAYGQNTPVIDGNVYRVLGRYYGVEPEVGTSKANHEYKELARVSMGNADPAEYNQAIMNFGAVQCVPRNPGCGSCPLSDSCFSNANGSVQDYPRKKKKAKQRQRWFNYLVVDNAEHVVLSRREQKDIWENLYEFPNIESEQEIGLNELAQREEIEQMFGKGSYVLDPPKQYEQVLSHQKIHASFWKVKASDDASYEQLIKVARPKLEEYAFPRIIDRYLRKNILHL